jgi:uncharacterized repeat protein (TIGR01451 family)
VWLPLSCQQQRQPALQPPLVRGLTIAKVANPTSIAAPGVITYTITVENTGNVNLTSVAVSDAFAGGATFVSGDESDTDVLNVGETWIYTADYEVTQADINLGTDIVNTASVVTTELPTAETASATTTISQAPGLTIAKVANPTSIAAPGVITYTITVENTGNVNLTSVAVSDAFAGGATFVSGDESDTDVLNVGETWIYTADYEVTQADINLGTDIVNTASVVTTELPTAETATATTTITQTPGLTIAKVANPTSIAAPGVITYTITVENTGNVNLTSVAVSDAFAGGATFVSGDESDTDVLNVGETWIYTADYEVTQADINLGTDIVNTASVVTTELPTAETATATTTITQTPGLTIAKVANPTSIAAPGVITYTITVVNDGNTDLTNVVLTDIFAGGATLASGDTNTDGVLDTDETWIYTADYEVTQANIDAGTDIVNTASVVTTELTTPEVATATTTITQTPGLTVNKSATPSTYTLAGEVITFTIDVENTGNVTITGITVTDPLTGLNSAIASLAPGGKQTFTQTYQITQANLNSGSVTNTATVTGKDPDNVTVSDSDSETVTANKQPGLTVNKSATPSTYTLAGEVITFTIDVENTGNVTITGITVTDPLTGLNSAIASLAPGGKQTFTQTYQITQANLNSGSVTNTATVTGKDPDNVTVSDSDSETVTANKQPGLTVNKSATPSTYTLAGEVITFTIDVENTGNVTITGITVTDPLTGLNSAIASLTPGGKQTFTQTYQITQANLNSGSVTNTATVTGKDPDNVTVSDSDSETVTANKQPGLTVNKSATPSTYTLAGEVITFTIDVENTGNVTITGITVTDPLTGLNSAIASLTPGGKQTFTQTYQITQANLNSDNVTGTV